MITNQAYLFLIFTLNGIFIGLLFDFFRILRKSFKTSDFVTYIEDIIFWILTAILVLYSAFIFNNGEFRIFMFIGIFIGVAFYMLLLSNYIIRISVYIITAIKKITIFILSITIYPAKKVYVLIRGIFYKPIKFIIININNLTKNAKKFIKIKGKKGDFANKSRII